MKEFFSPGESYPLSDFLARSRTALNVASDRVKAKYGWRCSRAMAQLARIETAAAAFARFPAARVRVDALNQMSPVARHSVAVIGGRQAGLSISWYLTQSGIDHVVFEKERVAHAWRAERWDLFCLVTPTWQCRLPGFPYHGPDPHGFMLRSEIVAYMDAFVASFAPLLLEGVAVRHLRSDAQHGFMLDATDGIHFADQVVVATGGYQVPIVPRCAEGLPADIVQIHSSLYRNPGALPDGAVLVVGSGQSGCQIAEDLHLAGRKVHLCVGDAPRVARRYRGKDVVEWLDLMGYYDLPVHEHPLREGVRDKTNHYVTGRDGGRDIDLRQRALEGMELYGRLLDVRAIAWCAPTISRFASTRPIRFPKTSRPASTASSPKRRLRRRKSRVIGRFGLRVGSGRSSIFAQPASHRSSVASAFTAITLGSNCLSSTAAASRAMSAA